MNLLQVWPPRACNSTKALGGWLVLNFLNFSLHLESIQFESDFEKGLWFLMFKRVIIRMCRDGNGAGFFGYSSHPASNGTGFKFNNNDNNSYSNNNIFFFFNNQEFSITKPLGLSIRTQTSECWPRPQQLASDNSKPRPCTFTTYWHPNNNSFKH